MMGYCYRKSQAKNNVVKTAFYRKHWWVLCCLYLKYMSRPLHLSHLPIVGTVIRFNLKMMDLVTS